MGILIQILEKQYIKQTNNKSLSNIRQMYGNIDTNTRQAIHKQTNYKSFFKYQTNVWEY